MERLHALAGIGKKLGIDDGDITVRLEPLSPEVSEKLLGVHLKRAREMNCICCLPKFDESFNRLIDLVCEGSIQLTVSKGTYDEFAGYCAKVSNPRVGELAKRLADMVTD